MSDATEQRLAVLIDADNISAALAGHIFRKACALGVPIARRAYGMVKCFASDGGWAKAQREYGVVARPQVSNVSGKNVADIALVIDAMEFLYKNPCEAICIVSSDSDFAALASKIREAGKVAYGMGGSKAPTSFRNACTKFLELPQVVKAASADKPKAAQPICPRCGGKLTAGCTTGKVKCLSCASCGGMSSNVDALKTTLGKEEIFAMIFAAQMHAQPGCACPCCGESMSILNVKADKKQVEIDVCGNCRTIWYDKGEFEAVTQQGEQRHATISTGKAYRREIVLAVAADLRSGRLKVLDRKAMQAVLRASYHVSVQDITPIISTLQCQRVIQVDSKNGKVRVLQPKEQT